MAFKHKYSYDEKQKIIMEYLNNIHGFRELCRIYGMSQGSLKGWIRLYNTFGFEGLKTGNQTSHYSANVKHEAVNDYLTGKMTASEIMKKYKIRSETQLRRWIMKYNGHESLKSSGNGGNTIVTKGRKTTYEERIEIVKYCIEHDNNYSQTSNKFQVSYQQIYSWIKKYEVNGVAGLMDKRGRVKPDCEMSELEKLRAENRLLKAENKRQKIEVDFLKKLDEIERRRG